ncbi:Shedu anti-phage system protein SduA domain-containing protein [Dokdonia ponticola]|uniref:Shedu anti-phage system protein SduA domain-containing protein n=1 Tax=Dokdonia ponticola TaxID=2041041 RepID=A0ABV9HXI8_9FLAO
MGKPKKKPIEKLITKVNASLRSDSSLKEYKSKVKIRNKILFEYNSSSIKFNTRRYYPSRIIDLVEDDFKVTFKLNHETLALLGSSLPNPPRGAKTIIDLFRKTTTDTFSQINIGGKENKISGTTIYITTVLYKTINKINQEEGKDKAVRFQNRTIPFLKSNFKKSFKEPESEKDYSLLFQEVIASGKFTQQDILSAISELDSGENNTVVIEKQINKQVEWLIEKLQEIIDIPSFNISTAQELGNKHFGFSKLSITGIEHLMEMILTKYGKYTIFGVPVLLNTDKYVVHKKGLPRSQFDIILINHLSDIELVELKKPDTRVLDYDNSRNKFYASKELSVAVSQAERYVSAIYREHDEDYLINGKKIRDFLNEELGGSMNVEIVRPKALIVIGTYQSLVKDYEDLADKDKKKVSKEDYSTNYLQAYKELKDAYKNIHILTYSELIENARTRFYVDETE